jgi:hypothetical protein
VESPGSRSIVCRLGGHSPTSVIVRIIYQDDVIDAQVAAKEKDDI